MKIQTHKTIDHELCGTPLRVADGSSQVQLHTTERMTVDESGLVHGGFVFGLADHAAMIAVNDPNVVLGAADVKFLKPVRTGDVIMAEASVQSREGKKRTVSATVRKDDVSVFEGEFICFVLNKHVLD